MSHTFQDYYIHETSKKTVQICTHCGKVTMNLADLSECNPNKMQIAWAKRKLKARHTLRVAPNLWKNEEIVPSGN